MSIESFSTGVFLLNSQWTTGKNFKTTSTTETSIFGEENNENRINNLEKTESITSYYIYGENQDIDAEFKLCSSNNQETYDLEADAKETTAQLKELIYSDDWNRSSQIMKILENNLDPANIDIILNEYKALTNGRNLQEDLDIVFTYCPIKKNKAKKLFDSLLSFENLNTKIDNKYWQGDSHNVTREGSVFTITNTETNETREIDLAVLLKNFDTSKERKKFVEQLQKLPAEVLMDIAAEQTTLIELEGTTELNMGNGATCIAAGYYSPSTDQVAIYDNSSISTIVHEMGHALDYNKLKGNNYSSVTNSETYVELFNEEMEEYLADGNKRYAYGEYTKRKAYATANEREMFAECYTLLMTGDCGSKTIIEKYFPRMLSYVKQYIEYNRSHSDSIRH